MPRPRTIPPRAIAVAVLSCPTLEAAAASLNRTQRWLYDQLKREDVQSELHALRAEIERRALDILVSSLEDAAQTMRELLRHDNARVRYDAARFILERFTSSRPAQEVEVVE